MLYWSKKKGERVVLYLDGVPLSVEKVSLYNCHYGEQYKNPKNIKLDSLDCKVHTRLDVLLT